MMPSDTPEPEPDTATRHTVSRPAEPRFGSLDPVELLAKLWKQNLPLTRDRVMTLERTAKENHAGLMTEDARTEAINLAHKLAGSLGMFGYSQGTEIARELEQLLEASEAPDADRFSQLATDLRAVLPL